MRSNLNVVETFNFIKNYYVSQNSPFQVLELRVEERKFNPIKFLGMMAAFFLIVFGSLNNAWRTVKMIWKKINERYN